MKVRKSGRGIHTVKVVAAVLAAAFALTAAGCTAQTGASVGGTIGNPPPTVAP